MEIKRPESRQPIPENAKKVFDGVIFDVYQWEQEMFDGKKKIFEKVKRPDTVAIFPVLPGGKILITEQEQPQRPLYVSAYGGRVDEGEDILAAAKRELLEESGYEAEEFILWESQQPSVKIEWTVYTFVAKGLRKVKEIELDGGEKIKHMAVTLSELIDIALDKKVSFSDKEIVNYLIEAKFSPEKRKELEDLFRPIEK